MPWPRGAPVSPELTPGCCCQSLPEDGEWQGRDPSSQPLRHVPGATGSPPWYEMLPTKHTDCCGGKPSSTQQQHQNQRAALTLHSRHHIRDPQFSPNQQATLEIEKALLKPPVQFLLTVLLSVQNSSAAQTLLWTLFRTTAAPLRAGTAWHQHHSLSYLHWVSKSVGRRPCQSTLHLLFALNEQMINMFPFWECFKYPPGFTTMGGVALDGALQWKSMQATAQRHFNTSMWRWVRLRRAIVAH